MMFSDETKIPRRDFFKTITAGIAAASLPWKDRVGAQENPASNIPKAKLVLIGGGMAHGLRPEAISSESLGAIDPYQLLQELCKLSAEGIKQNKPIVIVTCASEGAAKSNAKLVEENLQCLGIHTIVKVITAEDAKSTETTAAIENAALVFFEGGDQAKLLQEFKYGIPYVTEKEVPPETLATLKPTDAYEALVRRYMTDKDFVVAGNSAGAAAMAEQMIYINQYHRAGFGFTPLIVETHANAKRNDGNPVREKRYLKRMMEALHRNNAEVAIGLEEGVAAVIDHANSTVRLLGNPKGGAYFYGKAIGVDDGETYRPTNTTVQLPKLPPLRLQINEPEIVAEPVAAPASAVGR